MGAAVSKVRGKRMWYKMARCVSFNDADSKSYGGMCAVPSKAAPEMAAMSNAPSSNNTGARPDDGAMRMVSASMTRGARLRCDSGGSEQDARQADGV